MDPDLAAHSWKTDGSRVPRGASVAEAWLWIAFWTLFAAAVVTVRRPAGPLWRQIFDLAHIVLSGALALVGLRLSRRFVGRFSPRAWPHYVIAGLGVLVSGGGLEIAQWFGPGQASAADLARDLVGGLAALAIALTVDRRVQLGSSSAARRWGLRTAAVGLCFPFCIRPTEAVLAAGLRQVACPTLASFDSWWERPFLHADHGARFDREIPPKAFTRAHGKVAKVVFGDSPSADHQYPKLELTGPFCDWSAYRSLVFEVYSPATMPVTLEVRVHDRQHGKRYADRFNAVLDLKPGATTVAISLDQIAHRPAGRTMALARIEGIILFMGDTTPPTTLYFDELRLE
ncbi:hypothetical protein ACFL5O_01120 [Myxococcota bacterium]